MLYFVRLQMLLMDKNVGPAAFQAITNYQSFNNLI